jgi:hypothetical protein
MAQQQVQTEILVKATGKGFSIAIHGRKEKDGSWKCSLEKNEIVLTEIPYNELATSLGEQRHYDKTGYELSFEAAFEQFDQTEWFLCRPSKLHGEVADFVMRAFDKRWQEYDFQFPADSPVDQFIRKNKMDEWKTIAHLAQSGKG